MRILVAEDEVLLAKSIVKILKLNGYIAKAVYNGLEALDSVISGEYDMAILDVMMPKMDGVTVTEEIRKKGLQIPVLLLTARSEIQDKVTGLDGGANYYMTKPFDSRELLAVIRSFERTQTTEEAKLNCGNIILDSGKDAAIITNRMLPIVQKRISDNGNVNDGFWKGNKKTPYIGKTVACG